MTKTLTEQWREGKLKGYYYVHIKLDEHCEYDDIDLIDELTGNFELHCDDYIKEVLSPVPDYMDCKGLIYDSINLADARKRIDELVSKTEKLEKKLAIATKALEYYADEVDWVGTTLNNSVRYYEKAFLEDNGYETAQKALKEMKGVK